MHRCAVTFLKCALTFWECVCTVHIKETDEFASVESMNRSFSLDVT